MDFFQGAFLGPIWAQTDYQDHRHKGFHALVGFLALAFFLAYAFVPRVQAFFPLARQSYLAIFLVLLLVLPLAASRYFHMTILAQVLILVAYAVQYFSAWIYLTKRLNAAFDLAQLDILTPLGELANRIMTVFSHFFSFLDGLSATLAGVISSAIFMGLAAILLVIASILLPLLYFYLIKRIQRLIDYLLYRILRGRRKQASFS